MDELNPIAGNALVTTNECERLAVLAGTFESGGQALRGVRTDSWTGRAADAYADIRDGRARAWLTAADCHDEVRVVLARYATALAELKPRADSVIADARRSGDPVALAAAAQQVARWHDQLAEIAWETAARIRAVTEEAAALVLTWPTESPAAAATDGPAPARPRVGTAAARPVERDAPRLPLPDPRGSHAEYRARLVELGEAVLRYWSN